MARRAGFWNCGGRSGIGIGECEQLPDAREREAGDGGPGFDGFLGTVKIVPGEGLDVGAENKIGVALPNLELVLLCGADGAAYDLENVGRGAAVSIVDTDGDGKNAAGPELPHCLRGNGCDQTAVGEPASSDFNRFEQAGEGATGADGVHQIAMSENDRLAIGEIGGDHGHGDAQVFEAARFEYAVDKVAEAMIAG